MVLKNIATIGCGHGELNLIYRCVAQYEIEKNIRIDLVIVTGDFQANRNNEDLACMHSPPKYRKINDFWEYYMGIKIPPYLTLFIGGNHEAMNHLQELPYGGWVCQNIYYIGISGSIYWGDIHIVGISGIYNSKDYKLNHYEIVPYNIGTCISSYHIKNIEINKLFGITKKIDIFLSHDWPSNVAHLGDLNQLYQYAPHMQEGIEENSLGCPYLTQLLYKYKPDYWLCGHHHVNYTLDIRQSDDKVTHFLATAKAVENSKFIQHITVESSIDDNNLYYDIEWLTILRHYQDKYRPKYHTQPTDFYHPTETDINKTQDILIKSLAPTSSESTPIPTLQSLLKIPLNFQPSVSFYDPRQLFHMKEVRRHGNPQTDEFLQILKLNHTITIPYLFGTR